MSENKFTCFGKVAVFASALKWEDVWIQIDGFWLEVTKKIGQPCTYLLPLDLVTLSGGFQETSIQNSICMTTTAITGGIKIYFQTTNRYDIIRLFQAIKSGQTLLTSALISSQIPRECQFRIESTGVFGLLGKAKMTLTVNSEFFELSGAKGSQRFEFGRIQSVHAKLNDSNAHTRICINVDESGYSTCKEYTCLEHENLKLAILCFLMNSHLWHQENHNDLINLDMVIQPIVE